MAHGLRPVRLLMVTGLPGSGKSWLIDKKLRFSVSGLCFHDFHEDAIDHSHDVRKSRHYEPLLQALLAGRDCVIADIEFCLPSRREAVVLTLKAVLPELVIEYHSFRNQPDRCLKSVIARGRPSLEEERAKIDNLSKYYVLPQGALEYDVTENQ